MSAYVESFLTSERALIEALESWIYRELRQSFERLISSVALTGAAYAAGKRSVQTRVSLPESAWPFIDRVIGLSGNYTSYTSTRIRVVAFATWNEMNVAVHHRLASDPSAVDPYVETQYC
jgi:hypothetical protein